MSASSTALETIDDIIKIRASEKINLEKEISLAVAAAYRQRQRVLNCQPECVSATLIKKVSEFSSDQSTGLNGPDLIRNGLIKVSPPETPRPLGRFPGWSINFYRYSFPRCCELLY